MLRRRSRQYANSPIAEGDRERLKINKRNRHLSAQGLELTFLAGLHKLDAANKTATFYIMNTSRNRNRWGVSEKALSEAWPSLKGKKLGMGAGYRIDKHYPEGEMMDSGVFVRPDTKAITWRATLKLKTLKLGGCSKTAS